MKYVYIALVALALGGCTALEIRDNAKQTSDKLWSAYDRALSTQLDARVRWRDGCADLLEYEHAILKDWITEASTLEDKLAAIDLAIERHNGRLPVIHTVEAFTDGDGKFLNAVNEVTC